MSGFPAPCLIFAVALVTAGCTTAHQYPSSAPANENATVEGFSTIQAVLYTPIDIATDVIYSIDDYDLGAMDSSAALPPGNHTFRLFCTMPYMPALFLAALSKNRKGWDEFSFVAEAGHRYKFSPEQNEHRSCTTVVYDVTEGRHTRVTTVNDDNSQQ